MRIRSTLYTTDIGKTFGCPIFHVNADDPEAVLKVFRLTGEYRQKWHTDVIIDLIGYRRHGHNEMDQPLFTQPIMYQKIQKHPSAATLYKQQLVAEGTLTQAEVDERQRVVSQSFADAFERSKTYVGKPDWLESKWAGFFAPNKPSMRRVTGLPLEKLSEVSSLPCPPDALLSPFLLTQLLCGDAQIGNVLSFVPEGFTLHKGIADVLARKAEMFASGRGIDWATAEALAFGSLCLEGNRCVRSAPAPVVPAAVITTLARVCLRAECGCLARMLSAARSRTGTLCFMIK